MVKSFVAQLKGIRDRRVDDLTNIARGAIQDTVEDMQTPVGKGGNMPIDTGFLRNSLVSGINGAAGTPGAEGYALSIAGLEIGDVARFAYTANYAMIQELGSRGRAGRHFMGSAAANWQTTVARNAAKFK